MQKPTPCLFRKLSERILALKRCQSKKKRRTLLPSKKGLFCLAFHTKKNGIRIKRNSKVNVQRIFEGAFSPLFWKNEWKKIRKRVTVKNRALF